MRKRSKYRPRPVLLNPVGYVIESMTPVAQYSGYLVDLRIKNSSAMVALLQGRATKADLDMLIAMSNMTEALQQMGFGEEYRDVCIDGRLAILSVVNRAGQRGRFTPTGPEIQKLNLLLELHDAQMEMVTVRDVEKALDLVQFKIQHDKDTIRLATVQEAL